MSIGLNNLKFFGDLQSSLVMGCAVMTKKREYSFFNFNFFVQDRQRMTVVSDWMVPLWS